MTSLDPWYSARDLMVDALIADLHGTEDDVRIGEYPLDRFIVGIIYPRSLTSSETQNSQNLGDDSENDTGTEVDADFDPGVSFAHMRKPSTIGLTAGITASSSSLLVEVSADRYIKSTLENESNEWLRSPFGPHVAEVPISNPSQGEIQLCEGLALRFVIRSEHDGVRSVTLVLVNTFQEAGDGGLATRCWFRPSLRVSTVGGEFADRRPSSTFAHMDEDELSGALLHRRQRHLAVGHGLAVEWDEAPDVREIRTTFFPQHELPLADASRNDVPVLDMSILAEGDFSTLNDLITAYEAWIESRALEDLPQLAATYQDTATRHLSEARRAASRMRRGVELISTDPIIGRSFRAMNSAMKSQRERQVMIRSGDSGEPTSIASSWRPFQMAFVLMNIEGLTNPECADRDLADVLWFPTGGGKTEAYLGLIAFCLVHRRLRGAGIDKRGAGVAVFMRYTLRLLTLQQFERAAGLICALEVWRAGEPDLQSKEPFSLGLWVGQGATPNNITDAAKALRKRGKDETADTGDPVQLLRCPWCGTRLTVDDYHVDRSADRLEVKCPSQGCPFGGPNCLPVHLVDSDVYKNRPSLVIGTVDKFAMLAWRGESGSLFGHGGDAPPELIIQDELHLISGPLGSLVGLYETAIDYLSTDHSSGARPKLVASTATIRRAKDQVKAVFAREARQFPPPGLEASDSFFAVDASRDEKGTRMYLGVMAPGTSHATLTVRSYAALLQAAMTEEIPQDVRDAYWTLLGYFTSLRVLGAAYIATIDDVRDRIKVVAKRLGQVERATQDPRELTSRKKSSEIPLELDLLQTPYPDPESPDTVLATNMISVGVDVDRLGLMVVSGQPQTTSEYIQATSRVGRRHPGLVVTLFNAGRSRDLSHYESFTTYHRSIYQQVEATGATPFASRALDRGLHGLLTILVRHLVPGAAAESGVSIPAAMPEEIFEVTDAILARTRSVSPDSEDEVEDALETLIEHWREAVEEGTLKKYSGWKSPKDALLVPAGAGLTDEQGEQLIEIFPPDRPAWPTLTSLRNVDRESSLRVIGAKGRRERKTDES
ncbi:MAG TPA: helicase-related protein [Aeromicrobium sp.]|nr:helicase-related protein [Aeromicrobium sp.]